MAGGRPGRLWPVDLLWGNPDRIVKPIDFYHLGVAEAPNASSEAQQRMVVGRVYYGLHHEACCRYFRANQASSPLTRQQRHVELCRRYNALTDATAKRVGNLLNDLRRLRVQADYELGQLTFRGRVLDATQLSNIALTLGQELLLQLEQYYPGEAQDGCSCPTQ